MCLIKVTLVIDLNVRLFCILLWEKKKREAPPPAQNKSITFENCARS
jgi:hypothetical protein